MRKLKMPDSPQRQPDISINAAVLHPSQNPDRWIALYKFSNETIYLKDGCIGHHKIGFLETLSHEYMHHIIHQLEGVTASIDYDNGYIDMGDCEYLCVCDIVDAYHEGDV